MDKIKFNYRNDIDGLRAISVFVVVFFHLGYLPNGYLGVDVFFVISGYLITGIIYRQNLINNFSVLNFYMKRIRRILPLVTLTVLISFIVGLFVMLPDDLENLSQSIIATNIFSNNILQAITTRNYWDTLNEFKPLMHTWSLAIEEQYYLFYPFIFFVNKKYILKILISLTLISITLFLLPFSNEVKFYYLPFRFFELSLGGIIAIKLNQKLIRTKLSFAFILLLLLLISCDFGLNNTILILITILLSCAILASNNSVNTLSSLILENKFFIFLGKISFSIYMWHQLCFAYTRYFITDDFNYKTSIFLIVLVFFLSILSYYFVEQPFRNKKIISDKKVLIIIFSLTLLITIGSFIVIKKGGLIRNVPELSLSLDNNTNPKIHEEYNDRNYLLNKNFENFNKIKILVIGDSFARDWINILSESEIFNLVEVSYLNDFTVNPNLTQRVENADIIFLSRMNFSTLQKYSLPLNKTFCLGDKNFGLNNGLFYNYSKNNFCNQRAKVSKINLLRNEELKSQWGEKFIDLIDLFIDKNNTVPVFTTDCKFISHDTRHLTQAGAIFFAKKINPQLIKIINETNHSRP